eukprot:m.279447 g.279447  ORF g.279447 m.279447 type:complete len:63 (-) comp26966_c0_seq1:2700-2888(-)
MQHTVVGDMIAKASQLTPGSTGLAALSDSDRIMPALTVSMCSVAACATEPCLVGGVGCQLHC